MSIVFVLLSISPGTVETQLGQSDTLHLLGRVFISVSNSKKISKSIKNYHSYSRKYSETFSIDYVIMRKTFMTCDVS